MTAATALFCEGINARHRVDHRLLADLNEAGTRPIEVQNEQYHDGDKQSHDVHRQRLVRYQMVAYFASGPIEMAFRVMISSTFISFVRWDFAKFFSRGSFSSKRM